MAAAPLLVGEDGSFAYFTITQRLPRILRTALKDVSADWSEEETQRVTQLADALEKELLDPREHQLTILEADPSDEIATAEQARYQAAFGDRLPATWADFSFLEAETYFYYRLINLLGYHKTHVDHFKTPKASSLLSCKDAVQSVVAFVNESLAGYDAAESKEFSAKEKVEARFLMYCSLWGNRVDLSLFKNAGDRSHTVHGIEKLNTDLLTDSSSELVDLLARRGRRAEGSRLDVILDNFGYELVTDLTLVVYLLERGFVETVVFHTKAFPTFVSDSTTPDVHWLMDEFKSDSYGNDDLRAFAETTCRLLDSGRLVLKANTAFNDPLDYTQFPAEVLADELDLKNSTLCILKGDLNYRRLVGDRHWPVDTSFDEVVGSYFPCSVATLRTLKSEVSIGLSTIKERVAEMEEKEKETWRVCGKYGVIQSSLKA